MLTTTTGRQSCNVVGRASVGKRMDKETREGACDRCNRAGGMWCFLQLEVKTIIGPAVGPSVTITTAVPAPVCSDNLCVCSCTAWLGSSLRGQPVVAALPCHQPPGHSEGQGRTPRPPLCPFALVDRTPTQIDLIMIRRRSCTCSGRGWPWPRPRPKQEMRRAATACARCVCGYVPSSKSRKPPTKTLSRKKISAYF